MKKLFVVVLLYGLYATAHAQNNDIEAIAAYQMAEEYFNTGNNDEALKYIRTAKLSLGTDNGKILYLEILILEQLAKTNKAYLKQADAIIKFLEISSDYSEFSLEKRVEVAKIKIAVKEKIKALENTEKALANMESKKDEEATLSALRRFPKTGIPLAEFLKHPYATRYKNTLDKPMKKVLSTGGEISSPYYLFANNEESEHVVHTVKTNGGGIVIKYVMYIEVDHTDYKKAASEIFGTINNYPRSSWEGKDKTAYVSRELESTTYRYKRNGRRTNLNYLSVTVY